MIKDTWTHELKDRMFIDVTGIRPPGFVEVMLHGRPVDRNLIWRPISRPIRLFIYNETEPSGSHRKGERVIAKRGDMMTVRKRGYDPQFVKYQPGTGVLIELAKTAPKGK